MNEFTLSIKATRTIRCFAVLLLILVSACSDSGTGTQNADNIPGNDGIASPQVPNQPGMPGSDDPSDSGLLNASAFLLTTGESTLYKVDALSGRANVLHSFGDGPELTGPADIINDTVYVTAEDNSLNAISLTTGEFLWDVPIGAFKSNSYPTAVVCDDDTCFAFGETGILLAVNASDGSTKWSTRLLPDNDSVSNSSSQLVVAGNRIYINVSQRRLLSTDFIVEPHLEIIDRQTGQVQKQFNFGATVDIAGDILVLRLPDKVRALNINSLEELWQVGNSQINPQLNFGRQAIAQNVIALPVFDETSQEIVGLDLATGNQLWAVDAGSDEFVFRPTTDGRLIYAARGSSRTCGFFCPGADSTMAIDPTNGAIVWQRRYANLIENPLVVKGAAFYGWYRDYVNGGPTDGPASDGAASINANTGEVNWFARGINTRGASWFVGTPILVQDGQVYRSTNYPDARP